MPTDNTVYIGKKDTMQYVLAVVAQFHGSNEVSVKARGKNISRAVDVAEIVRNRYVPEAKIQKVEISTEKLAGEEGRTANVSSIEIFMFKEGGAVPPAPRLPRTRGPGPKPEPAAEPDEGT